MLACLFFLFCGTNAITTFFSLFAQEILHKITSEATILMLIFAIVSAIAALPAGKMGKKFGRKKTIMAGLSTFLAAFIVFFGIFIALLGGKNLSISNYITINNDYTTINDAINNYNSEKSDEAKAAGIELKSEDVLTVAGYIEYANADVKAADSPYAVFEEKLIEKSGASIKDHMISDAVTVLGADNGITYGEALTKISDTVGNITGILGVLIFPVLILGGAANMFITVNTLPLVLEIGGIEKVGTFTGYYYTATFSAQIASPILYGFIRMFAGTYMSLFYYSPIVFALAMLMLIFVKHGEAIPDDIIKEAEEADA